MVAVNPRLAPHFRQLLPTPWLPERAIWRAVLGAYAILGAVHLTIGSTWIGALCTGVALTASPRVRRLAARALAGRRDGLLRRWRRSPGS